MNDRDNNMKRMKTNTNNNTSNSNTSNNNASNNTSNNTSNNNTSNNSINNIRNNSNYSNSNNKKTSSNKKESGKNNLKKIQNKNTRYNKTGHKIKNNNFKLLMKDMSIDTDKLIESNIDTNKTNSCIDSKINSTSDNNNTISNDNTSNKDYKPRYNFKKICKEISVIADEIRESSKGLTVIELNSPDEFPEKFWNTFIKTVPYSEICHDKRLLPIINNIKSYLPIISTMPAYFQYINLFDDISFPVITINNSIYFGWKNIPIESVYNDSIFIDAMKTRITFELGRYLRSCKIREHKNKSYQMKSRYAERDNDDQTISQTNNKELSNTSGNSNSNNINNSSSNNSSNNSNNSSNNCGRNNKFKSKYNSIASSQINMEQLIPSNMVIIDIPRVLDKMSDPAENRFAAREVNLDIRKIKYYNSLLYNCYSMTLVNDSLTCINASESDAKKVISTYKKIDELVMFANCIYKLKLSDLKFNSSSDEADFIINNFDYLCKVKKNECKNIKKIV